MLLVKELTHDKVFIFTVEPRFIICASMFFSFFIIVFRILTRPRVPVPVLCGKTTRWWILNTAIFTVLNELVFINLKQKTWQAIASLHCLMVTQPTASKQHVRFSASCKWFGWKPRAKLNRWENNVENICYLSLSRNSFQSCQFGPITIQNLSRAFLPIHIFRRHKDFFFFQRAKATFIEVGRATCNNSTLLFKKHYFHWTQQRKYKKKILRFRAHAPNWELGFGKSHWTYPQLHQTHHQSEASPLRLFHNIHPQRISAKVEKH